MKTHFNIFLTIIIAFNGAAQNNRGIFGTENWTQNWTNYKPKVSNYRDAEFILNGEINTNTTLSKKNTYLLVGNVVVKPNVTLTIEPGTIIRGDYQTTGTLIIQNGGKIMANGTETDPIIFTSNKGVSDRNAGDWGGIAILGNASINRLGGQNILNIEKPIQYGGTLNTDNSGVFRYVRIEFAGKNIDTALTLAAVGQKTVVEFVQVSFSKGNGFMFLGGDLKTQNLISFKNSKHDFDFNEGAQISLSNSISFKFPYFSDASSSNCIDIKSYTDKNETDFTKKLTNVSASNITMINFDEKLEGIVNQAVLISENAHFALTNSVIHGFFPAVVLNSSIMNEKLQHIVLKNNLFNFCKDAIMYDKKDSTADLKSYFSNEASKNSFDFLDSTEVFEIADFKSNSNFMLKKDKEKNSVSFR